MLHWNRSLVLIIPVIHNQDIDHHSIDVESIVRFLNLNMIPDHVLNNLQEILRLYEHGSIFDTVTLASQSRSRVRTRPYIK